MTSFWPLGFDPAASPCPVEGCGRPRVHMRGSAEFRCTEHDRTGLWLDAESAWKNSGR